MEHRTLLIRGRRWHAAWMGSGPPVLLLHGFTGLGSSWEGVARRLADTCTTVVVDLPGHGRTDESADGEGMQELVDDVAALMTLLGFSSFALVGYSMGGRIAIAITCTHPDRVTALVAESASPGLATCKERNQRRAADEGLADQITREGIAAFVEHWESIPLFASQRRLSPEAVVKLRQTRLSQQASGLASSLRSHGTGAQPSFWDQLSLIRVPVLLITGREDRKFCGIAQDMVQLMPNGKWIEIANAGHTVHLEQPDSYIRTVQQFFMECTGGNRE